MLRFLSTLVKLSPLLLFFVFTPAYALTYQALIFDNYTLGEINGQDSWSSSAGATVFTAPFGRDGKVLKVKDSVNPTKVLSGVSTTSTSNLFVSGYFALGSTTRSNMPIGIEYTWSGADKSFYLDYNTGSPNNLKLRASGGTDVIVSTGLTQDTWYYYKIEWDKLLNQVRIVNWNGLSTTSPWVTIANGTGVLQSYSFSASSDSSVTPDIYGYYDDIYITDSNSSTSTSNAVSCSTCTRVISFDPDTGEVLSSTTNGYTASVAYYVSLDDFCDVLCTTFIELAILPPLSSTRIVYTDEVANSGVQLDALHYFSEINATGTYSYEIKIYNRYFFGALRTNLLWDIHKFYVGQANTLAEISAYSTSTREQNWDTISTLEDGSDDLGTASDPGVIPSIIENTAKEFLLLPPWGYVVYFNIAVQSGTSSGLSSLPISFPTSSPAHSLSLNLPLSSAFDDAIATVRAQGVTNEIGDSYDQIEYYWELFWYIVFTLWLIREVSGFSFFTGTGTQNTMTPSQRESMTLRVGNRRGDIDMRNP